MMNFALTQILEMTVELTFLHESNCRLGFLSYQPWPTPQTSLQPLRMLSHFLEFRVFLLRPDFEVHPLRRFLASRGFSELGVPLGMFNS